MLVDGPVQDFVPLESMVWSGLLKRREFCALGFFLKTFKVSSSEEHVLENRRDVSFPFPRGAIPLLLSVSLVAPSVSKDLP